MSEQSKSYSLYYSKYCYFCQKVLQALGSNVDKIVLRNTSEANHQRDLIQGGGRGQVPCLRIGSDEKSAQWLYESDDIIQFLKNRKIIA